MGEGRREKYKFAGYVVCMDGWMDVEVSIVGSDCELKFGLGHAREGNYQGRFGEVLLDTYNTKYGAGSTVLKRLKKRTRL